MRLETFLPYRLSRLAASVSGAMSEIYGKRHGLTRDEWRVLAATGELPMQPTRAIAEQTGLDKVAISRAASSLEDRKLIRRTEAREDRRIKILNLTRRGEAVLREVEQNVRERESFLIEGLEPDERAILSAALTKLAERADALNHPRKAPSADAGEQRPERPDDEDAPRLRIA